MLLPTRKTCLAAFVLFIGLSIAVFGQNLRHEFVSWDDQFLIVDNDSVKGLTPQNVKAVFTSYDPELYIPLTFLSYQVNYALAGMRAWIFHATDLVLHTGNALLVAYVLWLLIGSESIALLLGLLFLVHPLNVESVAWAAARKDTLSTFFYLLSLIGYLHYRMQGKRKALVLSLLFFVLGLLSKVMIVTLPLVLVVLDLYEGRTDRRRAVLEKVPYVLIAIIFGVVSLFGKAKILVTTSLLQKFLMACVSTLFYPWKFLVPVRLSVMYPWNGSISLSEPLFVAAPILCVALIVVIVRLRSRFPWLLTGALLYFLTLIPTFINFAKGGEVYFASDRYAYVPMIGLLFILGHCLILISHRWSRTKNRAVSVALVAFLAYLSFVQASTWSTSESLYTRILTLYPQARSALNNMGMELLNRGQYPEAIDYFDRALAVRDDPLTRNNKASAFEKSGDLARALAEYKGVLKIDPNLPEPYYGIASIAAKQEQPREAAALYRKAIALKPDYANAINNLGAVYLVLHDWDNAIATFTQAIKLRPSFAESYYNLGGAYEAKGMLKEAAAAYQLALKYNPDDADARGRLEALKAKE